MSSKNWEKKIFPEYKTYPNILASLICKCCAVSVLFGTDHILHECTPSAFILVVQYTSGLTSKEQSPFSSQCLSQVTFNSLTTVSPCFMFAYTQYHRKTNPYQPWRGGEQRFSPSSTTSHHVTSQLFMHLLAEHCQEPQNTVPSHAGN